MKGTRQYDGRMSAQKKKATEGEIKDQMSIRKVKTKSCARAQHWSHELSGNRDRAEPSSRPLGSHKSKGTFKVRLPSSRLHTCPPTSPPYISVPPSAGAPPAPRTLRREKAYYSRARSVLTTVVLGMAGYLAAPAEEARKERIFFWLFLPTPAPPLRLRRRRRAPLVVLRQVVRLGAAAARADVAMPAGLGVRVPDERQCLHWRDGAQRRRRRRGRGRRLLLLLLLLLLLSPGPAVLTLVVCNFCYSGSRRDVFRVWQMGHRRLGAGKRVRRLGLPIRRRWWHRHGRYDWPGRDVLTLRRGVRSRCRRRPRRPEVRLLVLVAVLFYGYGGGWRVAARRRWACWSEVRVLI